LRSTDAGCGWALDATRGLSLSRRTRRRCRPPAWSPRKTCAATRLPSS